LSGRAPAASHTGHNRTPIGVLAPRVRKNPNLLARAQRARLRRSHVLRQPPLGPASLPLRLRSSGPAPEAEASSRSERDAYPTRPALPGHAGQRASRQQSRHRQDRGLLKGVGDEGVGSPRHRYSVVRRPHAGPDHLPHGGTRAPSLRTTSRLTALHLDDARSGKAPSPRQTMMPSHRAACPHAVLAPITNVRSSLAARLTRHPSRWN
jgi:hypothetical protein